MGDRENDVFPGLRVSGVFIHLSSLLSLPLPPHPTSMKQLMLLPFWWSILCSVDWLKPWPRNSFCPLYGSKICLWEPVPLHTLHGHPLGHRLCISPPGLLDVGYISSGVGPVPHLTLMLSVSSSQSLPAALQNDCPVPTSCCLLCPHHLSVLPGFIILAIMTDTKW